MEDARVPTTRSTAGTPGEEPPGWIDEERIAVEPSPPSHPQTTARPQAQPRPRPDPEFAPDPVPGAPWPAGFTPADHQRLVVNPFLAVAALVGWAWLTRRLFSTSFPPSSLLPTLLLAGLPMLIHTHCVDCGQTGVYPRWRSHACPKVVLRGRADRPRWFDWPSARTQLVVWGYILGAVALLLAIVGAGVALLERA